MNIIKEYIILKENNIIFLKKYDTVLKRYMTYKVLSDVKEYAAFDGCYVYL